MIKNFPTLLIILYIATSCGDLADGFAIEDAGDTDTDSDTDADSDTDTDSDAGVACVEVPLEDEIELESEPSTVQEHTWEGYYLSQSDVDNWSTCSSAPDATFRLVNIGETDLTITVGPTNFSSGCSWYGVDVAFYDCDGELLSCVPYPGSTWDYQVDIAAGDTVHVVMEIPSTGADSCGFDFFIKWGNYSK